MGLYNRLCSCTDAGEFDENADSISKEEFVALITESFYGNITREYIIARYNLVGQDVTDLDVILNKPGSGAVKREMAARLRSILILSETIFTSAGAVPGYSTPAELKAIIAVI